ncbi:MAG: FHA domain-containing protein [Gemmataceae bacterium]|nr:FHA domain-containing protein [Gemmataceae bacterium]
MLASVSLDVLEGPQAGVTYRLTVPGACTIGRASDCDFALVGSASERTISRHHCRLEATADDARIWDLDSCNGTYVNGDLVGKRPVHFAIAREGHSGDGRVLLHGDIIHVAGVRLRVTITHELLESEPAAERSTVHLDRHIPQGAMSW